MPGSLNLNRLWTGASVTGITASQFPFTLAKTCFFLTQGFQKNFINKNGRAFFAVEPLFILSEICLSLYKHLTKYVK